MRNEPLTVNEGLKAINKFFAAPVLLSESLSSYTGILRLFIDVVKPYEFIEAVLVKDIVDATWEMKRYSSYKLCVIDREYRRNLELELKPHHLELRRLEENYAWHYEEQAKEAKKAKVGKKAASVGETDQADQVDSADVPPTQRMLELDAAIDDKIKQINEKIDQNPEEADHALALQTGINSFKMLDQLYGVAMKRRNDALAQIDEYRQGLGQHLRQVSDKIINGECHETNQEAPSIAGPETKADRQGRDGRA
jgi:hypothetical protein